ncbi:MAG: hypothetical protein ACPGVD_08835 [Flavobacteriales bacterium]
MNFIKQITILIACFGFSFQSIGQNFPSKVKNTATMVFTINGKNVLNKVSEDKINQSLLFREFKQEVRKAEVNQLSDMGIDFKSNFCFASESDTNMMFVLAFVPIKDLAKFETLVSKITGIKVVESDKFKSVSKYKGREMIAWNQNYAVFVSGNYYGNKYKYRYNSYNDGYNYYEENQAISRVLREDTAKTLSIKEKSDRVDEILGNKKMLSEKFLESMQEAIEDEENRMEADEIEIIEDEVEVIEVDDVAVPPPPPPAPEKIEIYDEPVMEVVEEAPERSTSSYSRNNYRQNNNYAEKAEIRNYRSEIRNKLRNRAREIREKKRNIYVNSLFENRVRSVFADKPQLNSVASYNSYSKNQDKKADGFLWVKTGSMSNGMQMMMNGLYDYPYRYRRRSMFAYPYLMFNNSLNYLSGDISVMNLYFEKDGVRYKQRTENGQEAKKVFNDIYKTSQDSRFLKYVNGDNFIGYISTSFSSAGLIKQFPKMYSQALTGFMRESKEEMEVLTDFMEVFMDEEAIGKIATGNTMFVLKDLSEKTVTYKTYEYDENFKRTRVEKTKKEFLPDFLLMFTTEKKELLSKFFKLGIKHKVLTNNGVYFTTKNTKSDFPMDVFFAIKDGICFLTTDESEIKTIMRGGDFNGISKKHSKLIKGNSQVIYYNHDKLMAKIPDANFRRRSEREAFQLLKEYECKDIVLTGQSKNGNLVSEGFIHTPNSENNGALYLFNYINRVIEFGKF